MTDRERQLDQLLGLVAGHMDLDHCREVDERYVRALSWQEVDHPPLVVMPAFGAGIALPKPYDGFKRYTYSETFDSPCAMLVNMLLDRVVPGILLKDDSPLSVRNNHGTIQIASILGGKWQLYEDNFPWVAPLGSMEALEKVANSTGPVPDDAGILPRSFETLRFYQAKLAQHPPCAEAIQISLPDLQGPIDTAEQLWGSEIYYSLTDAPDLLHRLLTRIVDVTLDVSARFRKFATDRLDPAANTQHGHVIPGRILLRNDSSIMLSPKAYAEFVRPHDARLLREIGTGSLHFCGNGQHLIEPMLEIPDLRGLDFGEIHLMDAQWIYAACRERKVAVMPYRPSREDLISGKARRDYPTGVVFVYTAKSIEEAREVVGAHAEG